MSPPADAAGDRPVTLRSRFLPRLEGAAMVAAGLAAAVGFVLPTVYLAKDWTGGRLTGVEPWALLCAAAGFALGGSGLGGFLIVRGVGRFLPKAGAAGEPRR